MCELNSASSARFTVEYNDVNASPRNSLAKGLASNRSSAVLHVIGSGSPVDATAMGLKIVGPESGFTPDLVVSGANFGENLSDSIPHSGTVMNVLFAARRGVPAIALSVGVDFAEAPVPIDPLERVRERTLGNDTPHLWRTPKGFHSFAGTTALHVLIL